jgi:heme exporter protein D
VIADHWGFVLAAYGLAVVALTLYWRHLCRRQRELSEIAKTTSPRVRHQA